MIKQEILQDGKLAAVIVSAIFCMMMTVTCSAESKAEQVTQNPVEIEIEAPAEIEEEIEPVSNYETVVYEEIADDGFVVFDIPKELENAGGSFPEEMQRYVWDVCNDQGVSYSLVVAMIEIESKYQPNAISSCGAVGYMQILEKWHKDRMAKYGLDCADEPQANILVGVDFMAELLKRYDTEQALVVYNCGSLVSDSTSYSRAIMQRKEEIDKELNL